MQKINLAKCPQCRHSLRMSNTIRRNSKSILSILSGGYTAKAYTLSNSFTGTDCDLEFVKKQYESMTFAKASSQNGTVTIYVHSNCWYELTPEMIPA